MKLSIVIVNTSEWRVLKPCLDSVYRETTGFPFEVIVVDNASTDGSREHLAREFPRVRVVCNSQNLGFAASNNRGFAVATGEYVLMLNPDTEVLDRALEKTVQYLDAHPDAGIAACTLLTPDGQTQRSVCSFPSIWNLLTEALFLYKIFPSSRLFGRYYMTWFDYARERPVDWACGAFLMIRRKVFDRVGILDEQFFMYTEETDFCYRARQAGFPTIFIPEPRVMHLWTGANKVNKRIVAWSSGSQLIYFKKHFNGMKRALICFLKYSSIGIRGAIYSLAGGLRRNPALREKGSIYFWTLGTLLREGWTYDRRGPGMPRPWKKYA